MNVKKLKNKLIEFFCSDYYLSFLVALIIFFWFTGWEIAGTLFIVIPSCVYLWFGEDLKPVVTTIMLITMVYSLEQIKTRAFIIAVGFLIPVIAASFIYNLVHFKNVRRYTLGKLYYPMAIAYLAALSGGIAFAPYDKIWTFVVLGVGAGIYLLYFLCINCVHGDRRELFCKILFMAGLIVCIQTLVWYVRQGDLLDALLNKSVRVGWGMKNTMALVVAMAAPATVYLGLNYKEYSVAMYPVLALFSGILLMSTSRGNILFGLPIIITCWLVGLTRSNNYVRLISIITVLACVAITLISAPALSALAQKLFYQHSGGFFDDNGRAPLYKQALKLFYDNPVFGVGYFKYKGATAADGPSTQFLWKTHNTLFQIMCCNGFVGLIGLMPFYVSRYRLFFNDFSLFKFFGLLSLVAYECEGMVDVAFLSVHELFFLIGLFAAAELEDKRTSAVLKTEKNYRYLVDKSALALYN